jgi:hypothetical protein
MHQRVVVCIPEVDPLAQLSEIPPAALNEKLSIFCDPRQHPRAHAHLLEILNEKGIILRLTNPTFNSDHVQWMVKERICYALIREHEPLRDGLTTRPIQGVSFTVDSAIAYKSDSEQLALPLLLRDLEKRFPLANMRPQKKPQHRCLVSPLRKPLLHWMTRCRTARTRGNRQRRTLSLKSIIGYLKEVLDEQQKPV